MSLVRVSEGDGWVSELPTRHAPNKSLTPITLVSALPSIKPGHQGQIWPQTYRESQN